MRNTQGLKPFSKDNPPPGNGRPKGSKNRSTILKKWLDVNVKVKNPETNKTEIGTLEDQIILSLIREAKKGNVRAVQEILDTRYGKISEKLEVEQTTRVIELQSQLRSAAADAVVMELRSIIETLPDEYHERFQISPVERYQQTIAQLVEMGEDELVKTGLPFTAKDLMLLRNGL